MEEDFFAIKRLLDSMKIGYEVREHGPIRTAEEAARVRGEPMSAGVKSLVFKADNEFVIALVPGDKKADWNKLRVVTGAKNVRMATAEEVLAATHCEVGSVHPFGPLMPASLKTYMEHSILGKDHVNFSAGLLTVTIKMKPHDLKAAAKVELADLVKE